jgi:hypothetical protein
MPRKGHTEEQIIYALRQVEAGKKVGDICREMGVSQQAFYSWKRKYAGLGLNELRELRQLREENRKLKTLVADLTLDKHILQEVLSKKGLKPAARRQFVSEIRQGHKLSEKRACGLIGITRWINRYQSRRDPQSELRMRLRDLAGSCGYIESFNGRLRDECLNGEIFFSLSDAREKLERWRCDYNQKRPHTALGDRTPAEFAQALGGRRSAHLEGVRPQARNAYRAGKG